MEIVFVKIFEFQFSVNTSVFGTPEPKQLVFEAMFEGMNVYRVTGKILRQKNPAIVTVAANPSAHDPRLSPR